jgi:hypothetical protein
VNLGAEPKKLAILGAVVVIGAVIYFVTNGSGDSTSAPAIKPVLSTAPAVAFGASGNSTNTRKSRVSSDFRVRVGPARPEEAPDPATIDPELRLDLLQKVMAVEPIEAGRNLFQFGAAPPPETKLPALPSNPKPIQVTPHPDPKPDAGGPTGPVTAVTPPPPPINFKYFGYQRSYANGHKVAFLMDGEEPLLVEENQTVKQRYRIIRIDFKSIVIEDTQAKNTQTLQIQDNPPG